MFSMEKASLPTKKEYIQVALLMDKSMDMVNIAGQMDQYTEDILKKVQDLAKVNITIPKIPAQPEVYGETEY